MKTAIRCSVSSNLVTEHFGDVPVVSELRSVSAQQSISGQDGNSSQNEGSKQVGVDVVSGTVQLPADITDMFNCTSAFTHHKNASGD